MDTHNINKVLLYLLARFKFHKHNPLTKQLRLNDDTSSKFPRRIK